MTRQYIVYGPLGPIYLNESSQRQYTAFGNYINETQVSATNVALTGQAITSGLGSVAPVAAFQLYRQGTTNLLQYSQQHFTSSGGYWVGWPAGYAITDNNAVAYDGTTTASTIGITSRTSGAPEVYNIFTVPANVVYTLSCEIKAGTRNYAYLSFGGANVSGSYITGVFDLSLGIVGETFAAGGGTLTGTAITSLGNGWYRCTLTGKITNRNIIQTCVGIANAASGNTVGGYGDAFNAGTVWAGTENILVRQMQLEIGTTFTKTVVTLSNSYGTSPSSVTAQGSLVPSPSFALTGQSSTSSQGSLSFNISGSLTGQGVTAGAGSVSTVTSRALTGQAVSCALGSVTVAASKSLTGQALTASQGTVVAASSFALTGVSITSGQSTITAFSGVTSVALTGLGITSSQGSLTVSTSALLVGQTVVSTQGTILPVISIGVTGISLTLTQKSIYGILFVPSGYRTYVITNQGRSLTIDLQNRTLAIDSQNRTLVITAQQRNITS